MLTQATAMLQRTLRSLYGRVAAFVGDGGGVSAVEFAVLAPLMITIYLGGVEVTQAVTADRKTSLVAGTVSNLVSQSTCIADADMTNILNASSTVATPFPVANLTVVVSSVAIDNTGKATIAWSDTLNGTKRTVGQVITLPAAIDLPNTSLIWAETYYKYKPTIGYIVTGTLTMYDQIYMKPRQSATVNRKATCP